MSIETAKRDDLLPNVSVAASSLVCFGLSHSLKTFREGGKDGKIKVWRKSESQRFYTGI